MAGSAMLTDDLLEASAGLAPENQFDEPLFYDPFFDDGGSDLYRQMN